MPRKLTSDERAPAPDVPGVVKRKGGVRKRKASPSRGDKQQRKSAGRPIALTPEKATRIIDALKGGAPLRVAAAAGGISVDALAGYRNPDSPTYLPDFSDAVARARDHGAAELLKSIQEAAKTEWRAAQYLLAVLMPEVYGKRVVLAGEGGGPIEISGELRVAGEIRANADATRKLHDAIATAAHSKK